MALCSDPAITYLKDFGYSVLRLPRKDFAPLQILLRQGDELVPLGQLATVMKPGAVALPSVAQDAEAVNISGQRTSDLSVGVGLNIIGGIVAAMGGSKIGLDAAYNNTKTVAFEFSGVFSDSVEISRLDQFLTAADVDPTSKHVATLLDADDIFVVTAIIKSDRVMVVGKNQNGVGVQLNVPAIQQLVGGNIGVSTKATELGAVTYEGKTKLVFGFQAVRLFYDNGHYTSFEPLPAGNAAARGLTRSPLPKGVEALSFGGAFARLSN